MLSVWRVVSIWFVRMNQRVTITDSRARENAPAGRDETPWTCGQASGLPRAQLAEDRVFGQSRPLCVIAAIVLLLGDDRWKSVQ